MLIFQPPTIYNENLASMFSPNTSLKLFKANFKKLYLQLYQDDKMGGGGGGVKNVYVV